MKKIFKSKFAMGIAIGTLVASLGFGATYAWFTSQLKVQTEITLGSFSINASFDNLAPQVYEPGDTASSDGAIANTGDIAAVISVKGASEIAFVYADDQLNPWTGPDWVADMENAAVYTLGGSTSGIGYTDDLDLIYAWFYDKNNPDDKYLLLAPGKEIDLSVEAVMDGDVMGNKYQKAKIKVGSNLDATQTYDGALQSRFGISNEDLEIYFGDTRAYGVHEIPEAVMKQINDLMNRL